MAVRDDFLKLAAPAARGPEAAGTALITRHRAAELARTMARLEAALDEARKYFDKLPEQNRLDFIDKMELGEPQGNAPDQAIADTLRKTLDAARKDVQDLGTGKLENWIENYFPHIWKDPKAATLFVETWFGKRPMEGKKAFLKKRSIPTVKEGIAYGLEPASTNPVELALAKLGEMNKYIFAHRTLNDMKAEGLVQYIDAREKIPAGYAEINDKIATVFGPPTIPVKFPAIKQSSVGQTGGMMGPEQPGANYLGSETKDIGVPGIVIRGRYVAPEPAARVINNYLSPGLRGEYALYRGYINLANVLNQFQLGFSAFHLGFTTLDAAVSKLAFGIYQAAHGHPVQGLVSALKTPIAPFTGIMQGDRMLKEYYKPGSQGMQIGTLVEAMVLAGGRAKMDSLYQTNVTRRMVDAFHRGGWGYLTSALRIPAALAEQTARPILEYIVPRQKMAVFADLAQFELQRAAEGKLTPEAMEAALARAWDSVDNRMGQLVYDNLFWNKVHKDLLMASVRSVGWNVGTIREVLGGAGDIPKLLGKNPDATPRLTYLIALPVLLGLIGALTHYLATGEAPAELKDYYFPRSGKRGTPGWNRRLSFPSYIKDIVHVAKKGPYETIKGKLHPMLTLIADMISNKDYFDAPIRNENDKWVKQFKDTALFAAESIEPMAWKTPPGERPGPTKQKILNALGVPKSKRPASGSPETAQEQALRFVGITKAPSYITGPQPGARKPFTKPQHVPTF